MSAFIDKKSTFKVNYIESPEEVDAFATKKLSILFIVPKEDLENQKIFTSICANYETVDCAFTPSKTNTKIELQNNLGVIMYRSFDDGVKALDLTGGVNPEAIK